MTKYIAILLLVFFSISLCQAQNLGFLVRYNSSFGFIQDYLNYNGLEYNFSPGGGFGLELGLDAEVAKGFSANLSIGYQQNLVWQFTNTNGFVNETSFKFNRKFISIGIKQRIRFSEHFFQGMFLGGGMNYSIPGKFKIVENEWVYGDIEYSSGLGFHGDIGFTMLLSKEKRLYIEPGFRVKILRLNAKSYQYGTLNDIADSYRDLNVSGIEVFSIGLIKKFK